MIVLLLKLVEFLRRMYDRHLSNPKPLPKQNKFRERFNALIGITGYRMARYRQSWKEVVLAPLNVVWRPHLLSILLFEVCRLLLALSILA